MKKGLNQEEVYERIKNGQVNSIDNTKTKSIKEIVLSNIFTYFNLLNIFLGLAIIVSGIVFNEFSYSIKNCLFLGVVFCNTLISIVQEIMSKKTIDKMSLLSSVKQKVWRDNKLIEIDNEEIVLDDLLELNIGSQIVVDAKVVLGRVEVNESFITGESKTVLKNVGDELISGSFVVSGECLAKVFKVGQDSYINVLTSEAKKSDVNKSVIFNSFEKLIKVLSYVLIPLGILLFLNQYFVVKSSLLDAIINTVAALIGMIPEGLFLLTSSVMAVSVIRLSKYNVLVQKLYCIENLARVNVICLDKTGTLTTGNMHLAKIIPGDNYTIKELEEVVIDLINALPDNSGTFEAIRKAYPVKKKVIVDDIINFSSERKFSACQLGNVSYYVGAADYILKNNEQIDIKIKKLENDYRILLIAKKLGKLVEKPSKLEIVGYLLLEDEIREEAKETLKYFHDSNVLVKIISGDNPKTVTKIAKKVGIENIKAIDARDINENNINDVVLKYDVFGRVTPQMKKNLVIALKKNGYTVAMTGDGVNDVLALKEADTSISVATGSDATKSISQLVLLDSNFSSMPKIVLEGRRTINNIERSASLLLVKTIYTILLIFTCLFFKSPYFFIPIQLTLITACTIGIPSFILALEPNKNLVDKQNFLLKIFEKSLPASLTVFFNIIVILILKSIFKFSDDITNHLAVLITGASGFIHLYHVSKPFNILRFIMFISLILTFIFGTIFMNEFFFLEEFTKSTIFVLIILIVFSILNYHLLNNIVKHIFRLKNKNNRTL